jgi:hypothetical protein
MNLEAIAPLIEDIIKKSLEEKQYRFGFADYQGRGNKVASGRLKNSVEVKQTTNSKDLQILEVLMIDYAQYVQGGRRRDKKGVPIKSLLQWIKDRGLRGRDKKGKFIKNISFAFAIQKNITKYGIRSANFIDISIEKILADPRIEELIGEATYEDLLNAIEGI